MKILVCGGTGFIGRNILEYFQKRSDISLTATHFRREPWAGSEAINWTRADLRDPDTVADIVQGQDIIIQAAATTSGANMIVNSPHIHVTDNAVMNSYLFRAAADQGVRHVVFFSCTIMYGNREEPFREEEFDHQISSHYFGAGWTKVYLEKMCQFFAETSQTGFTALRHSNIYGPWDKYDPKYSHVFAATLRKVIDAQDGKITIWGSGEEKRDLLYVEDLVRAVEMTTDQAEPGFRLLNIGCGHAVRVLDIARAIIDASGKDLEIHHDLSRPSLPSSLSVNCDKARDVLGWQPKTSLAAGIRQTLDWYKTQGPAE